jgi:hypothetical protein
MTTLFLSAGVTAVDDNTNGQTWGGLRFYRNICAEKWSILHESYSPTILAK